MGSETRARLGLAGLLLATLFAYEQLFEHAGYWGPVALAAGLAILVVIAGRRVGAGALLTAAASFVALGWYLVVVFQSDRLFYGLPTPGAAANLWRLVLHSYASANLDFAPIPVRPGYVIMAVIGMWIAGTIGELATFRWHRPLIASLPCVGLFSFLMVVGHRRASSLMLALFLIALLLYWALEASHRLRTWGRWLPTWSHLEDEDAEPITGGVARKMGAACLGITLIAPLLMPAFQDGLLVWRTNSGAGGGPGGGGGGTTVDLLVSLVPEALDQSDQELFTVNADRATYWRLGSLGRFDGESWQPVGGERIPATTRFSVETPPARATDRIHQEFRIDGLRGEYLPAAATPTGLDVIVDSQGREASSVLVDPTTEDLKIDGGLTDFTAYDVTSDVSGGSYRELARAFPGAPEQPVYAEIPELSAEVEDLRDGWIAGKGSPFERLVAIQNRLRKFEYSTEVEGGTSTDYLTEFLTTTRTGYCQQFSTAFALLSRSLGYATRVSVGFLPGDLDTVSGTYTVRGTNAHAWPEVLFEGFGWIAFEPTPRDIAPTPAYTTAPVGAGGEAGGEAGEGGGGQDNINRQRLPQFNNRGAGRGSSGDVPDLGGVRISSEWQATFNRLLGGALALLVIFLAIVPLLKEARSRARYRAARGPDDLAVAAFAHFQDEAAELASPRRVSESAVTYARRIALQKGALAYEAEQLARINEAAQYSPSSITQDQAGIAAHISKRLRSKLWSEATWWQRGTRLFSPAGLRAAPATAWDRRRRQAGAA